MSLSLTQTSLVRITAGQAITNNLLRLLALSPSTSIAGSVGTADLEAGAVTPAQTTPGAYFYGVATGTNAYALTLSPALGAYANGVEVLAKFTNGNTSAAAVTLDVDGLGAKAVYHRHELALAPGDVQANDILKLRYNTSRNSGAGGWDVLEVLPGATIRRAGNVTAGTANAQTVTNVPPLTGYTAGTLMLVKVGSSLTNTGALTLNSDGLGARDVKRADGSALRAQDWLAGKTYLLYDDGTQWIILTKEGSLDVVTVASARNLLMFNAVGNENTQATLTADEVVLKTSDGKAIIHTGVSLTINIALGVALNGLETGVTEAASTWYYVWLISDGTNIRAVLEDAGSGDGAIPAGPDLTNAAFDGYRDAYKALVGAIRNDGSSNFKRFWQRDRDVYINVENLFSAFALATSWTALSSTELTALRAAVPPIANIASGQIGRSSNTTLGIAVSATKDDGTADTTYLIGLAVATGESSASPVVTFNHNNNFRVPLRGGANRNLQLIASATTSVARMNISGYSF